MGTTFTFETETSKTSAEPRADRTRNRYLIFCHAGTSEPGEDAYITGASLVTRCLEQIAQAEDSELFPPKLFLLLVTPIYLEKNRDAQVFAGVQQTLLKNGHDRPALIGSSVPAVIFDEAIHPNGAVLVCLASRFLDVKVESEDKLSDPAKAMSNLVNRLGISADEGIPSPEDNRSLLVFFPEHNHEIFVGDLHRNLLEAVQYRIPLFGAVSSANSAETAPTWNPAVQFDLNGPHRKAVVAALLTADFPIARNLMRGLQKTPKRVTVKSITRDNRIDTLESGETWEQLDATKQGFVLLGEPGTHDDEVVGVSYGGAPPKVFRNVRVGDELEVLEADSVQILKAAQEGMKSAMRRSGVEKPEGCLAFYCVGFFRNRGMIGLDFSRNTGLMQDVVGKNIVGAFVDGEIGNESSGRPASTYWSAVRLAFGDELRDRAAVRIGNSALADHFAKLAAAKSLDETIQEALETVRDAGFAGAMISLIVGGDKDTHIVAQDAIGSAFQGVLHETRRKLDGTDALAVVATTNVAQFIENSHEHPATNNNSVRNSGVISQYIVPLTDYGGTVLGVMQVDLGDLRSPRRFHTAVKQVLDAIAFAIAASIARVASFETGRIVTELDTAFNRALSCRLLEQGMQIYVEAAIDAFRLSGGHIRVWESSECKLRLLAGKGPYYEAARRYRERIDTADRSLMEECFLLPKPAVHNNAQAAEHTMTFIASDQTPGELKEQLKCIGSFLSVPFKGGRTAGTLTLQSEEPWFFHTYRERCAKELADRAGLLAGHLEATQEHDTADKELAILLKMQDFLKHLDDTEELNCGLAKLSHGLREVFGADVCSLFLYDRDVDQFILRAQDGWAEPNWIGAARYQRHDGWTGSVALEDRPRVFPDVTALSKVTLRTAYGRFGRAIWGSRVNDHISVRALSMPLRYGTRLLGVAILSIGSARSGERPFSSESPRVLANATGDVAAHLAAAVVSHEQRLAARMHEAREAVLREFADAPREGDLAAVLCHQACAQFGAREALFYFTERADSTKLRCQAAFPPQSARDPDDDVRHALRQERPQFERVADPVSTDPQNLARVGTIRQAWIPTVGQAGAKGVIQLVWDEVKVQDSRIHRDFIDDLGPLGKLVGRGYQRYLADRRREAQHAVDKRSAQAVQAMSFMISNSAHRLINLLAQLKGSRKLLLVDQRRDEGVQRISEILGRMPSLVERPLMVARKVAQLEKRACELGSLIEGLLKDYPIVEQDLIKLHVDQNCIVWTEPDVTAETFRNIIDNALDAIHKKPGLLTITAIKESDGFVNVRFHDTGIGMSSDKVKAVLDGFVTSESGGFGVLLARISTEVQGGTFSLDSNEGVGTRVSIRLPEVKQ